MDRVVIVLVLSIVSLFIVSCLTFRTSSYADIAQKYESQGDYEAANKAYLKHISLRLELATPTENPYFYYLLIGDNYLRQNNPSEAKVAYNMARMKQVEYSFLVDRAKTLAKYYADRINYEEAIKILREYRDLDTVAIDYEIDFMHKRMLEFEDNKK